MKPITFTYTPVNPDEKADILSVYIDGVGSSQMRPGPVITALLNEDSDLLAIRLPADLRFSKKNVLRAIHNHPRYRGHRGLIRIVGLSMGALLGHDLIEYSRLRRVMNPFELVIIDGLTGLVDIKNEAARWLKYAPPISIRPIKFDRWLGKKLIGNGPTAPFDETLDDEYKALIREHEALSKSIRFSGWLRHMKYLINHKGPRASVLVGVKMGIIESLNDTIVKQPQAHCKWEAASDGEVVKTYAAVDDHGLLMEFPFHYAEGLEMVLSGMRLAA
jgi:hypothetical protein